jgi:hypothetical protein
MVWTRRRAQDAVSVTPAQEERRHIGNEAERGEREDPTHGDISHGTPPHSRHSADRSGDHGGCADDNDPPRHRDIWQHAAERQRQGEYAEELLAVVASVGTNTSSWRDT